MPTTLPAVLCSDATWWTGHEKGLALRLVVALVCGVVIGAERELRGKPAGISTNSLVIGGAAIFTYAGVLLSAPDSARIAAQVISGVGFLGAGIIMRSEHQGEVTNLTTAASVWFSASVGVLIGFGWYSLAGLASLFAVVIPRIPRIPRRGNAVRTAKTSDR